MAAELQPPQAALKYSWSWLGTLKGPWYADGSPQMENAVWLCKRVAAFEHTCTRCLVYTLPQLQISFGIKYLNTILSAPHIISYGDPDLMYRQDTAH